MIDISVSFLTKAFALSVPIGVVFCAVLALAYLWVLQNQDGGLSKGSSKSSSKGSSSGASGRTSGHSGRSGGRSSGAARSGGGASRGTSRGGGGGSLLGGVLKELGEGIGAAGAGVGRGIGETLKGSADVIGKSLSGVGTAVKGTGEGAGKVLGGVGAAVKGVGEGGGKLLDGVGGVAKGVGEGGGKLLDGTGSGVGSVAKGVGEGGGKLLGGAGSAVGSTAKGVGEGGGKLLGGVGSLASGLAKPLGTLGNGVGRVTQAVRDEVVGDVWWGWQQYTGYRAAREDNQDDEQQDTPLPRNVFDAGTADDAETIRDICKAVGIEASVDGTHVAINPHKLKEAERVLAMADYDVTFADEDDDEVILDFNENTGEWELAQGGQTWRDTFENVKGQVLHWWDPAIYPDQQAQAAPTAQTAQNEKVEA